MVVVPGGTPRVLGVWTIEAEEAGLRRLYPRAPDATIARLLLGAGPEEGGCYAVVQPPSSSPVLCPDRALPGRAFCAAHGALGWRERACPWSPPPCPGGPPRGAAPAPTPAAPAASPWADWPPIPPRSWTRTRPWGDERYAEDACGEDWARLARALERHELSAVRHGETMARRRPRPGGGNPHKQGDLLVGAEGPHPHESAN